ncbi:formate dehydrogenase subunit delta [Paraburkholderia kururiensis]|uniref:formate dehydrogenase subunit delta n=1 Tax=Paraburkholderia kururiensis TaxID=984307 RepID=UPI0039A75273
MDQHHLIEMANQIGSFFESMPDREEATASVADHIRRFWEPRMRRALYAAFDASTPGMSEIVSNALTKYREQLTPVAA